MAPGNHCTSGNTWGCRMSWTYLWVAKVAWINTRVDRVLQAMTPLYHHTSSWSSVPLYIKGRIEVFTTGSPHTSTIVITAEIESRFVAKDDLVPFFCSPVSSCVAPYK
ncbi:hypothetical protein TNCV_3169381 [Trichonephila clavipes]|nr:hypothetical protein TNCV_3169381 [Trichonephila clavipes]